MTPEASALFSFRSAMERARFHETGTFRALYYRSLPVPAPGPAGPAIAFFFGPAEQVPAADARPPRVRLGVPTYIALLDADTGRFRELRAVSRDEVGVPANAPEWLGELPEAPAVSPEEFAARRARLLALFDALAPTFAAGDPEVPPSMRAEAAELLSGFDAALEAPLVPCYRAVASSFLAWAGR